MDKSMTIYVSLSTDSRTAHIGRYFLDIRDTTRETQDPRGRQMTTRVTDNPRELIEKITAEGIAQGVLVEYVDETGE